MIGSVASSVFCLCVTILLHSIRVVCAQAVNVIVNFVSHEKAAFNIGRKAQ
jgi:hypothetical protein